MNHSLFKKITAALVILPFLAMAFYTSPSPVSVSKTDGEHVNNKKISSTSTVENTAKKNSHMIVREGEKKSRKKFPWLLAAGGAVVLGVIIYLLVDKKDKDQEEIASHALTVNIGEGVTGTPAQGTTMHEKGTKIDYNFTLLKGYKQMTVTLNGTSVSQSGSITMNRDHTLLATAQPVSIIQINSIPQGADILLDGSNTGNQSNHRYTLTTAGSLQLSLQKAGYLEFKRTIQATLGTIRTITARLVEGLKEHFADDAPTGPFWQWVPHPDGNWLVQNGEYTGDARLTAWNFSYYNQPISKPRFTVTARIKRSFGTFYNPNSIFIGENSDPGNSRGYVFAYSTDGAASAWRLQDYTFLRTVYGNTRAMRGWFYTRVVNRGLDAWNTIKIVRDGNRYAYYLNDILMASFTDSTYDPRYVAVVCYGVPVRLVVSVDFVKITDVGISGRIPPDPSVGVKTIPGSLLRPDKK